MKTTRRGEWRLRKWNEMRKRQPVKFYSLLTLAVLFLCTVIVISVPNISFPDPRSMKTDSRGVASSSEASAAEKEEPSEPDDAGGASTQTGESTTGAEAENEDRPGDESEAETGGERETDESDTADAEEKENGGSAAAATGEREDGGDTSSDTGERSGGGSASGGSGESSGGGSASGGPEGSSSGGGSTSGGSGESSGGGSASANAGGSATSGTQPSFQGVQYSISAYAPGDLIGDDVVYALGKDSFFSQTQISDRIFERIYGKSYKEDCTVPREDLRYVSVLYYDFRGNRKMGEVICNKAISQDLVEIFKELYEHKYPIEKISLVDDYDADDDRSSSDNNTSCFNYRTVAGKSTLSLHAKGLAIDINPKYNPYIRMDGEGNIAECLPRNGNEYTDRGKQFSYKIDTQDLCYKLFTEHGFTWGGGWTGSERDYMHFSKSEVPEQ